MSHRSEPAVSVIPPAEIQQVLWRVSQAGCTRWRQLQRRFAGELRSSGFPSKPLTAAQSAAQADAGNGPSARRNRQPRIPQKQLRSLLAITPAAALQLLGSGGSVQDFLEQVDYNGARLAKLAVPLEQVEALLLRHERLLLEEWSAEPDRHLLAPTAAVHHLRFAISITLNNAYHRVRQAEAEAFYRLFSAELESATLDELLVRHLEILREFSGAAAALLCWKDGAQGRWVVRARAGAEGSGSSLRRNGGTPPAAGPNGRPARPAAAGQEITRPENAKLLRRAPASRLEAPIQFRAAPSRRGWLLDPTWERRYHYFWSIPLAGRDGLAGVMQFAFPVPYEWLPRELELLSAAAERCLLAAEKTRLLEELALREAQIRHLADKLSLVEERERRRISNELHDEAGQSLLLLRLQLEMLESAPPQQRAALQSRLREMRELTERTIVEIRRLLAALSPKALEKCGLEAALRQLASRFREHHPRIRLRLQLGHTGPLSHKREVMLYRLVQECLNNVAKHSQASTVNISLTSADGKLRLMVKDDGIGFLVEEAFALRDSYGLAGMRERVALLGGRFALRSSPGAGTMITVDLPVVESAGFAWEESIPAADLQKIGGPPGRRNRPGSMKEMGYHELAH